MKKRKYIVIPQISSTKIFPNISELKIGNANPSDDVIAAREEYARMALLLFYPFRSRDDLVHRNSFWDKYLLCVNDRNEKFWPKGFDILQNIQDINYNFAQMTKPVDPITATTVLKAHEDDKK